MSMATDVVDAQIEAYRAKDVERFLSHYANDASVVFQPGDFGGHVIGMDVQVHPGRAVAQPLDEQPGFLAVKRGAVIFGVLVALRQLLADGCAPERQLAVVLGGRDINHDPGQPAVVSHSVNLRGLAAGQRRASLPAWHQRTGSGR